MSDGLHNVSRQGLPHWMDKEDIWQDVLLSRLRGQRRSWRWIAFDHARRFNGFAKGHLLDPTRPALRFRDSVQAARIQDPMVIANNRMQVRGLMARCTPREYLAIYYRYWEGRALLDIGRRMGVSESRACQVIQHGLGRMRGK